MVGGQQCLGLTASHGMEEAGLRLSFPKALGEDQEAEDRHRYLSTTTVHRSLIFRETVEALAVRYNWRVRDEVAGLAEESRHRLVLVHGTETMLWRRDCSSQVT